MSHSRKHSPSHPSTHTVADLERALARSATQSNRQVERRTIEVKTRAPARRETEIENLNKARGVGAITRERVKSPLVMPEEIQHRIESEAFAKKYGGTPEPRIRLPLLNTTLDEHEYQALAQYIKDQDTQLRNRQISSYGEGQGGRPAWDRTILNETQRSALQRQAFVHKYLNREDRYDLEAFSKMVFPVDDNPPKTPAEFGAERISSLDKRQREGAFLGIIKKIAQRLADLYKLMSLPHQILVAAATRHTMLFAEVA